MYLRQNILPKCLSDWAVTSFLFIIIPSIYFFELFVILPQFYELWSAVYVAHFIFANFLMWNICSNLVCLIMCDTSIKGRILAPKTDWKLCATCETLVPPRSWHCKICDICILKRDHHCMFTSCCIGHDNERYFMVFGAYMFVATVYANIYNVLFIMETINFSEISLTWTLVFKIIFPLAFLFANFSVNQWSICMIVLIVIGNLITLALIIFHGGNILKGLTQHERTKGVNIALYNQGWRQNFIEVFGRKWYLVWLSPFIQSELPSDGIQWGKNHSNKVK